MTLPEMGSYEFTMQMRDSIKQQVLKVLAEVRPQAQYGTVISVDRTAASATVLMERDTDPVTLEISYNDGPFSPGDIVRIEIKDGQMRVEELVYSDSYPGGAYQRAALIEPVEVSDGLTNKTPMFQRHRVVTGFTAAQGRSGWYCGRYLNDYQLNYTGDPDFPLGGDIGNRLNYVQSSKINVIAGSPQGYCEYTINPYRTGPLLGAGGGVDRVDFPFTGSAQSWTVPSGITQILVDVWGGGNPVYGGGYRRVLMPVTAGESLQVNVGERSRISGKAGFGGGGSAVNGYSGAGGSDVRQGGTALTNRTVVAGGAGGPNADSSRNGGAGGGLVGGVGDTGATSGGGGTQSAGGAGGIGASTNGSAGASGVGGNATGNAGAGGGGFFGGGSGGINTGGTPDGGGGGGSNGGSLTGTAIQQDQQGIKSPSGDTNGYCRIYFGDLRYVTEIDPGQDGGGAWFKVAPHTWYNADSSQYGYLGESGLNYTEYPPVLLEAREYYIWDDQVQWYRVVVEFRVAYTAIYTGSAGSNMDVIFECHGKWVRDRTHDEAIPREVFPDNIQGTYPNQFASWANDKYYQRSLFPGIQLGEVKWLTARRPPEGYLLCDGSVYDPVQYSALFQKIGTTFGGTATAPLLPNLVGKFARADVAGNLGGTGGANSVAHTHTTPAHSHTLSSAGWATISQATSVIHMLVRSVTAWTSNRANSATQTSSGVSQATGATLDGATDSVAAGTSGSTTVATVPPYVNLLPVIKW